MFSRGFLLTFTFHCYREGAISNKYAVYDHPFQSLPPLTQSSETLASCQARKLTCAHHTHIRMGQWLWDEGWTGGTNYKVYDRWFLLGLLKNVRFPKFCIKEGVEHFFLLGGSPRNVTLKSWVNDDGTMSEDINTFGMNGCG